MSAIRRKYTSTVHRIVIEELELDGVNRIQMAGLLAAISHHPAVHYALLNNTLLLSKRIRVNNKVYSVGFLHKFVKAVNRVLQGEIAQLARA